MYFFFFFYFLIGGHVQNRRLRCPKIKHFFFFKSNRCTDQMVQSGEERSREFLPTGGLSPEDTGT